MLNIHDARRHIALGYNIRVFSRIYPQLYAELQNNPVCDGNVYAYMQACIHARTDKRTQALTHVRTRYVFLLSTRKLQLFLDGCHKTLAF